LIHIAVNSALFFSRFPQFVAPESHCDSIINLFIKVSQHSTAFSLAIYVLFTAASQGKLYFLP